MRIDIIRRVDIAEPIQQGILQDTLFYGDEYAHRIIAEVWKNGAKVDLTGAGVQGYVVRSDGVTIALTDRGVTTDDDGDTCRAYIDLLPDCYAVEGRVAIILKVTGSTEITTVLALWAKVAPSYTDAIQTVTDTLPDLSDVLAKLDAVETATAAANAAAAAASAVSSVRYDVPQSLTESQQEQARENIGAFDALDGSDLKSALDTVALIRKSANLFDKSAIITNKYISTYGGIGVADINDLIDHDYLNVSPIIPIENGKYVSNSATNTNSTKIFAYDANGKYKGGVDASVSNGVYTYNLIGNISFIRFQYLPSVLNVDEYMFVKGESLPETYEPYGTILISGILYDEINNIHDEINTAVDGVNAEIDDVNDAVDGVNAEIDDVNDAFATSIVFSEHGFINANGSFVANEDYRATDFIDCASGGTYVPYKYGLRVFTNAKIAYYDKEKTMLSVVSPSSSASLEYVEGVLPYVPDAKYVRFCTYYAETNAYVKYATVKNFLVDASETLASPCDYTGDEISVFNKILCIGDSLTSGTFNYRADGSTGHYINDTKYSYPTYLKKLTGCETSNMGNGGLSSAEWYNAHKNDDLSGYDCAIIQLGVNDRIRYTTWGETSETAFTNIINKLKTENKNIKIFVANIIPATSYSDAQYIAFSSALLAWVTSTYASDANVIPLDMQQYGHTKDSPAYNCGHLSAYGYWRLAQDYKGYIGWYMNQNKTVFKEVQFIGTDYYYDPIT